MLNDLVGEASGKGVLRAMRQKHGPVAFEAIIMPDRRTIVTAAGACRRHR